MRIAFLCKRRYMGKDVILDRYARLYEIPFQLAKLGHEVRGYCLDYHGFEHGQGEWTHDALPGSLHWESRSLGKLKFPAMAGYPLRMLRQLRDFAPDLLIGASDIPQVALAGWLAGKLSIPYAIDLYDNFEGFGQAGIPGFKSALRHATCGAGLVTTTSEPLRQLALDDWKARGNVISMPSSVDKAIFRPFDRALARENLGLPAGVKLIGTAGGLYRDKGIEPLYSAWEKISDQRPDIHLVLAGPTEPGLPLPKGERVHYLGHLAHTQVAQLFNALDVGVISILDTPFGRYCFPQKAYEMLACGLAVAAADVGAMSSLFRATPGSLFVPGDAASLAGAVIGQLEAPAMVDVPIQGWNELIAEIEPMLVETSRHRTLPR